MLPGRARGMTAVRCPASHTHCPVARRVVPRVGAGLAAAGRCSLIKLSHAREYAAPPAPPRLRPAREAAVIHISICLL